tara:strand:- start:436 stop:843 length:408 start_codon:yes stop_codon:yes gene_type:complete
MKSIGIEIDKKRAICFALEKDNQGIYINLTGKFKYIDIKDDQNNIEIQNFQSTIHTFFENINPDRIAIISRQTKGKFASSPLSFKLEGLIQCYNKVNVEFVAKATLTAHFKKNSFTTAYDNNYQENAAKLANYLL